MATKILTLSLPSALASAMQKRIKELDTDRSKYIRGLVRRDIGPAKPIKRQ